MFKTLKKLIRCLSIVPLMCTSMFSHNQVTYDLNNGSVKSANINVDNGFRVWSWNRTISGTYSTNINFTTSYQSYFASKLIDNDDTKDLLVYFSKSSSETQLSLSDCNTVTLSEFWKFNPWARTFISVPLSTNSYYFYNWSFFETLTYGSDSVVIGDDSISYDMQSERNPFCLFFFTDVNNNIISSLYSNYPGGTFGSGVACRSVSVINQFFMSTNGVNFVMCVPYNIMVSQSESVSRSLSITLFLTPIDSSYSQFTQEYVDSTQSSVDELQSNYDTLNTEYASLLAKYNSLKAEYKLLSDKIDGWFSTYSSNGTNFYNPNQLNTISVEYRSKSESSSKIYTYSFNLSDSASIGLTDFQYDFNKIACLMLKNITGDSSYSSYDSTIDYINGSTYIFKKFTLNFKSNTIIDKNEYLWYETGDDRQYSGQMNVNNSSSWVDLVDNENHANYGDYTSFRWSELVSITKVNSLTFAMSSNSANACSIYKFGVVTDAYQVGYDTAYNEINDQINDLNAKYEKLEDQYKAYREKYNNKSYQQGYNDGRSSVSDEGASITTLFTSIVGVPITILNGLGVLTVWDIPLISVLLSLMFAMLLLWLIKKLI